MSSTLTPKQKLRLKRPKNLVREYHSCGINAILMILHNLGYKNTISIEELNDIFDYSEGIWLEQHRFRKLNKLLDAKKIPYRLQISKYNQLQDLFKQLKHSLVPVFFWMKVLNFTPKSYKDVATQIHFGDIHQDENLHILLMTGYDQNKDVVYFLDPSYQLPWIKSSTTDLQNHEFTLKKIEFYECVTNLKTFIEVKYLPTMAKSYKKAIAKKANIKEKQEELSI